MADLLLAPAVVGPTPPAPEATPPRVSLTGAGGRRLRLVHLCTIDMSHALLLAGELAVDVEAGLDVVAMSAPGPYVPVVEDLGVRHVAVPSLTRQWDLRSDARAVRDVVAALRALRPDVVHTHTPKAGVIGRLAARAIGVPVVVNTCHGLWLRDGDPPLRRAAVLAAEAVAAVGSHAELYQNHADLAAVGRLVGAAKGSVVGNGIVLDRFGTEPAARDRVRAELGVAPDELLVGGVGRFVAEKGVHELAACAAALGDRARFVWVGPDDDTTPPSSTGRGLRRVGERSDMAAVYAALDVFVLPSHREGFSRSAMEAAAAGLPMVLTDIRGCREIGRSEQQLLLVPPADPDALTAAVARLLDDTALRKRLGEAARARAWDCFDQREVALRSLEAYARVAAAKGLGWRLAGTT